MSFKSLAAATNTRAIAQNTPVQLIIPGREADQIRNSGGGVSFVVDKWTQFNRFLILGTEGGTFYSTEQKLIAQSITSIDALLASDPIKVVDTIIDVSFSGRAKKNDYAVLALALVMAKGSSAAKAYAGENLAKVVRTGTDMMHFVGFVDGLRGWGASLKRAVANWYNNKSEADVAYQAIKYQQRDGWAQRDVLRLSHPKADTELRNNVYKYIVRGAAGLGETDEVPSIIAAYEQAKTADESTLIKLILAHRLSHEMIPNEMKSRPAVWEALATHMGSTALIRNLNKLTSLGLLSSRSSFAQSVMVKLTDVDKLKRDRVHPLTVLIAQRQYAKGHGDKGSLVWTPSTQIVDALEYGFYNSFQAVEPTGKKFMLAVDVSGSMNSPCMGVNTLTCREAAAVMAMVTVRNEPNSYVWGFDHNFRNLEITSEDTLAEACKKTFSHAFGSTNCSLPMQIAQQNNWDIDCFAVYTDNETNQGRNHPSQALANYRQFSGKPAKLVSVGLAVNNISIADPRDKGMMDMAGFDAASPRILSEFAKGNV